MNEDYQMAEAEIKAYELGFKDGVEQGVIGGQVRGITFLINMLNDMRDDLLGIERADDEQPTDSA